jgi:hypothetical protein
MSSNISPRSKQVLFGLLAANVVATIFHYADNVCYFPEYPEPLWLNPGLVDAFWFVMTPLAVLGYWLIRRGLIRRGCLVLYTYAAASLLVLGHYRYAPFFSISTRIHLFILLEAALAVVLIFYVATIHAGRYRHTA